MRNSYFFKKLLLTLFIVWLSFCGFIKAQPTAATDYSVYPEDNSSASTTFFSSLDLTNEYIIGSYFFGSSGGPLKDARSGLQFSPINNVSFLELKIPIINLIS